jgi:hypothetical protein
MDETAVKNDEPTLRTTSLLGFLGDTHGSWEHLEMSLSRFDEHRAKVVIQLGDFGFVWPRENIDRDLDRIESTLGNYGQTLLFVDGNHEWFPKLYEYPIGEDGVRWLRPRVGHLPRGFRTVLRNGLILGALGGAGSIDRYVANRVEGESWWPEETITDADLEALGTEVVDILVGHEAPYGLDSLSAGPGRWGYPGWLHAVESRDRYMRAFWNVKPRLSLSGHWHIMTTGIIESFHPDPDPGGRRIEFVTRAVVLDADGPASYSLATLDIDSMQLRVFTRHGQEVESPADWRSVPERIQ